MRQPFLDALLDARMPLITEVKRRSTHGDDLFRGRPVTEIVAGYERIGAPCMSVVTGSWFGGDDALLAEVARLTPRPLLQKDFVTTRSQIANAKELGASAVLLTAELLPRQLLPRLITASLRCGVTPFIEVTDERQLEGVVHGESCVVAVNNKDIRTRERDGGSIDRSLALVDAVRATGTLCPVSASGIETPELARDLLNAGFRGLLVGTGPLLADDLGTWKVEIDTAGLRQGGEYSHDDRATA